MLTAFTVAAIDWYRQKIACKKADTKMKLMKLFSNQTNGKAHQSGKAAPAPYRQPVMAGKSLTQEEADRLWANGQYDYKLAEHINTRSVDYLDKKREQTDVLYKAMNAKINDGPVRARMITAAIQSPEAASREKFTLLATVSEVLSVLEKYLQYHWRVVKQEPDQLIVEERLEDIFKGAGRRPTEIPRSNTNKCGAADCF